MSSVLIVLGMTLWAGLIIRNFQVHTLRMRLLDAVDAQAKKEIEERRPWKWRFEEFESVTYDRMLLSIWKPVQSFYLKSPARETR